MISSAASKPAGGPEPLGLSDDLGSTTDRSIPSSDPSGNGRSDAAPVPDKQMREHAEGEGFDVMELGAPPPNEANLPPFALAVAPVLIVVLVNLVSIKFVIPAMDTAYLSDPLFGPTTIEAVRGICEGPHQPLHSRRISAAT